jgi:hypothetical protein
MTDPDDLLRDPALPEGASALFLMLVVIAILSALGLLQLVKWAWPLLMPL